MRLDQRDHGIERSRVADCELAEHLAVQLDAGQRKCRDEAVVADAALAEGGVEAGHPEGAEVPLFLPAVAVGVPPGTHDELDGRPVQRTRTGAEALGLLENPLALPRVLGTT